MFSWPFEHDIYEGEYWLACVEGIATIEENTGSGIRDDWTISAIRVAGVRERGKWEMFRLSDTSELYETILLQLLNDDRHEIDDEWATYIVEARIGNRADAQRDEIVSRELLS